jgi:hypothetical protein
VRRYLTFRAEDARGTLMIVMWRRPGPSGDHEDRWLGFTVRCKVGFCKCLAEDVRVRVSLFYCEGGARRHAIA